MQAWSGLKYRARKAVKKNPGNVSDLYSRVVGIVGSGNVLQPNEGEEEDVDGHLEQISCSSVSQLTTAANTQVDRNFHCLCACLLASDFSILFCICLQFILSSFLLFFCSFFNFRMLSSICLKPITRTWHLVLGLAGA